MPAPINPSIGESRHNVRLTADKVRAIRINRHGKSAKAMAKELGVHYRTIEKVQYYETWRHVR